MQSDNIDLTIGLVPHRIISDKDNYLVEHLLTGEFYEMPQVAIEAIEALSKGISVNQVEIYLTEKYPEEEIDMNDFLKQLKELDFIAMKDDSLQSGNELAQLFESGTQNTNSSKIGQFLFHRLVTPIYGVILFLNIVFFLLSPTLFPHPLDMFPFDSIVINIIVSMMSSMVLLTIHESGHVLAARAYGLNARVRLGHRLFLVVFETEMPRIWSLPRRKRNIPLIAGLCMDHTILFFSLSWLAFVPSLSTTVEGILGIIVLQLVMMSIYQCMFFMKTDLYYILQNVSGCYNLLENAVGWLKTKVLFFDLKNNIVIYDKELNFVRVYAVFYILGLITSCSVLVFYIIPQMIYSFTISFNRLSQPISVTLKLDAIIFFTQFLVFATLLLFSWSKKIRKS